MTAVADQQEGRLPHGTAKISLFSEVVVVGLAVALAGILVVPALPVMAAGVRHLRRHLAGEPDTLRDLARESVRAFRDLWPVGLAVPVLAAVLGLNLWAAAGGIPGGAVVGAVSGLLAVAAVVVGLRVVGGWRPGDRWQTAVRSAASRAVEDPGGSVLLVAAVGMVAVMVWMLEALLILAGGLLVMAVLAVETRWSARGTGGRGTEGTRA